MIGDIISGQTPISMFQPSKEVADFTKFVQDRYNQGWDIVHKPFDGLNGYSVIDRMNKDQRVFNSYVDESVESPSEAWKYRGTRGLAAIKAMAMHAHMTSRYVISNVSAQNEEQEEDRMMGNIMKDVTEWMTINSNYREAIFLATMGILVNPVTYLGFDFNEVMQTTRDENGKTNEILDEVESGFHVPIYSANEILIMNAYEQDIQRQPCIIKRRWIERATAHARWKDHENWEYVQPGYKSIFSSEDGLFYDVKDDEHPDLISEETFISRTEDTEVTFLGGVYMGKENVEANPVRHRDNRNAPKYNVTPFGYRRISEHFFYYKSLINIVGWDHYLLDTLWQIGMNETILHALMPVAVSGVEKFDTQIIFPGSVTAFQDKDVRVQPLLPPQNQAAIFNAISKAEESMTEATLSETATGQLPEASQKAFTVSKAEQHAITLLNGSMRNFVISLTKSWPLMVDIAIQHLTVAEVDEITNAMRYRKFILEDQVIGGKKVSKKIIFDESLQGKEMTKEEINDRNLELLKETGFPENNEHIYLVNPHLFSKMKYLVRYDPDLMQEKNVDFERAMAQNLYTMLRQDPLIEPVKLVRKLLNTFYRGEAEDLMSKPQMNVGNILNAQQEKTPQSALGAQAMQRESARALASV